MVDCFAANVEFVPCGMTLTLRLIQSLASSTNNFEDSI